MKIPKAFHPILGVLVGAILFLVGVAILTVAFVGVVKVADYAALILPSLSKDSIC